MFLKTKKIGFWYIKDQIYFVKKKKKDLYIKTIRSIFVYAKNVKKISWEETFIHEINLCYMY